MKLYNFQIKILEQGALLLKIGIGNSSSNNTWSKMRCISIKADQSRSILALYASMNATLSPNTATDSNHLKFGNSFTKIRDTWHHSVDTKNYFLYVKFEVRFVISFTSKSMASKK
jgi:hypothetical protein